MIVSIHQPNYFPWVGYFYKRMKSDIFVFLDDVQFSKNSYNQLSDHFITRVSILGLLFNIGIKSTKDYIQNSFNLL
jgi:hypothetical protein